MNDKCFGMNVRGDCICLNNKACVGYEACPFYKSRSKAQADKDEADARLCSLPVEHQTAIADKYYGGRMPWREYV